MADPTEAADEAGQPDAFWQRTRARLGEIAARLDDAGSGEDLARRMAQRAQALAAPERAADALTFCDFVIFGHGGARFALDTASAAAVVPVDHLVPLPGVDAIHLGLVVHQGLAYALVDLNALLDRTPAPAAPTFAVLIDHPDCAVGLAADAIFGLVRESAEHLGAGGAALVTALLPGGASVVSAEAVARNARLIVDHRLRDPLFSQD